MPTLIQILRELVERRSDEHVTGVADDHSTTSLTDTRDQKFSSADDNELDRKYVYLEAVKMQSRITEAGKAGSSGVLTLSPAVTDAPTAVTGSATGVSTTSTTLTDTGESMTVNEWAGYTIAAGGLYLDVTSNTATVLTGTGGWSDGSSGPGAVAWTVGTRYLIADEPIRTLKNAIAAVLRQMHPRTFFPLSLHVVANDNNDMEGSGLDGDYSKTNADIAAETTIVHSGAQSLKVTDDGSGGGYASVGSIGIPENKSLYAAIMCYVTSGDSATFRVIDVTDSNATIEDATTDEPSWMELVYQFSTPSDCEQIDFRFIADSASDVIYWDDFQVWSAGRALYPLPSWITRPEQVIGVRGFPQGTGGPSADNDYRTNERGSVPLTWDFERADKRAGSPLYINVDCEGYRPFIYALRPLPALTSDSGSTVADLDKVVFWAAKYLEAEPQERSEVLATLRSLYFVRPTMRFPRRVGA